ncbi:MAG: PIG-L family deacetylase [Jatrophihabitantaceae bacterium]
MAVRSAARRLLISTARDRTAASASHSVLVLAPHPDDETLGCGGRILLARRAGQLVTVVVATDGAASHGAGEAGRDELRALRSAELAAATARLGLVPADLIELGHPDGQLAQHRDQLADQLSRLLATIRPDEVYCTSAWESHPDHASAAIALRQAVRQLDYRPRLFEYPIWLWADWPLSRRRLVSGLLQLLALVAGRRASIVRLDAVRAEKELAVAEYRSQLGDPVDGTVTALPAAVLDRSRTGPELFFRITR